ncbi:hypothetical protein [uncultured Bifidobacterium sp.]|uniref:hypothetical protein n=1 Tax=uncultured Bifidobacterium sp. TaxID=165187 RepID=UPI0025989662|nr:hypothetical protein [uncultured Bifidobacterium sp.]
MGCVLSSNDVAVELYVVAMSTSLSSSMQPVLGCKATWFEAWQPSQDTLSITFRQPSVDAQYSVISTLRRWAQGNSMLYLRYPERDIDYRVVIRSIPLRKRYDATMLDATVTFQPLTNRFIGSTVPYVYTDMAYAMLGSEFITDTVDDALSFDTEQQIRNLFTQNAQFDGYRITYLNYPNIQIQFRRVDNDGREQWSSVYTVKMTQDLAQRLARGDDIQAYLKANQSASIPIQTPVTSGGLKKPDTSGSTMVGGSIPPFGNPYDDGPFGSPYGNGLTRR